MTEGEIRMIKRIIACTLCMILCLTLISFADNSAPVAEQPIEGQTPPEITMPDRGNMPDFAPPDMGNMPDFDPSQAPDNNQFPNHNMQGGRPGGFPGMPNQQAQTETPKTFKELVMEYITPIISVVLLALAFVFVIFYKRKNY